MEKIYFYRYKISWWEPDEDYKRYEECGLVAATDFASVMENLSVYYGETNIDTVTVYCVSDCNVIHDKQLKDEIKEKF